MKSPTTCSMRTADHAVCYIQTDGALVVGMNRARYSTLLSRTEAVRLAHIVLVQSGEEGHRALMHLRVSHGRTMFLMGMVCGAAALAVVTSIVMAFLR